MIFRQLFYFFLSFFKTNWTLKYNGEFGYELISVLPFAYWLHQRGKTVHTHCSTDTKPLYYFSDIHHELFNKRQYIRASSVPVKNIHRRWMNTLCWSPPPLKLIYKNDRFKFKKPLFIICNKYNMEWGNPPITFFSIDMLNRLFLQLTPKFQVIYCRPNSSKIIDDNSEILELNDHDFIRENHPNVICINDLHQQNLDLSFNQLQLMCFSNSNYFLSVQGGYSIFCSYFKGINIIYAAKSHRRTADEVTYNAYDRWYHKFSGATIYHANTYSNILKKVSNIIEHCPVIADDVGILKESAYNKI
jgi:hypothetical protein